MLFCVWLCVYLWCLGGADGTMVGKVPIGYLGPQRLARGAAEGGGGRARTWLMGEGICLECCSTVNRCEKGCCYHFNFWTQFG